MTRLLDGRPVAAAIRAEVAAGVRELVAAGGRPPGLAAVLVGDDPASRTYVESKARACTEVGIRGRTLHLPADAGEERLLLAIDRLNADDAVDGILVQLPLPRAIAERRALERVAPDKDVDGFHPLNVGRLWLGQPGFVPATPSGILELLRRHEVQLAGLHAVVVGRSDIVGKPVAALLLREHATVTICHSRTRDLAAVTCTANSIGYGPTSNRNGKIPWPKLPLPPTRQLYLPPGPLHSLGARESKPGAGLRALERTQGGRARARQPGVRSHFAVSSPWL